MRVHVVDPAAYTPPYDRALCAALAARDGLDVTLVTARFAHGDVPPATGFAVDEGFYRGTGRLRGRVRVGARLARHVPDMLRWRAWADREADVAHLQWLPVQALDGHLLPHRIPTILTAHDVLPRVGGARRRSAQRALYDRVDAIVAHSRHGRDRLAELGVDAERIAVIPHGALDHLTRLAPRRPPEIPEPGDRPVVLFFGLIRPYKGLDVLARAWREARPDAELWVVGQPRTAVPPLPDGTQTALRFVDDAEAAWCFGRADVVVLPYREIEQSGVLFTALAFGRAVIVSDVGGFGEVEEAVRVAPGDADALAGALRDLLGDAGRRASLGEAAAHAAATTYAWPSIAERHARLYARLVGRA